MANTNINLPSPKGYTKDLPYQFVNWLQLLFTRVGEGPFKIRSYSKIFLPDPGEWGGSQDDFTSLIYVYDEAGGATLAFSDGSKWRRVQDRAIVS